MQVVTTEPRAATAPISGDALKRLQRRSDARGLVRLTGHLAAIAATGWLYARALDGGRSLVLGALAGVIYGFTLVTMFAAMHESVHRTAFRTPWLNDAVAWLAGLLSFYNSTFFRHYHAHHHRFTQIAGKDPELDDLVPTTLPGYLWVLSGIPWWIGKLRTHTKVALGKTDGYAFLSEKSGRAVLRSVRLQLLVYGAAIAASLALGVPYFALYWLVPLALAQPLLRAILLAEHTGCEPTPTALSNTRTTHTMLPVRFLMWEMPFHAEHHLHPALPFFVLPRAHASLRPHLAHVARHGYLGVHVAFVKQLFTKPASRSAA